MALNALRSGTFPWLRAVYTVTVVTLLAAVVAARCRPGRDEAFWFGFAVFGWGYMTIAVAPCSWWGKYGAGRLEWSYVRPLDNPLLVTSDLVAWVADAWKDR